MTRFSGSLLRARRVAAHKTPEKIAAAADLSACTLLRYERGYTTPSIDVAARLAAALGCQVTEFLDGTAEAHDIGQLPPWAQVLIRDLQASRPESVSAA